VLFRRPVQRRFDVRNAPPRIYYDLSRGGLWTCHDGDLACSNFSIISGGLRLVALLLGYAALMTALATMRAERTLGKLFGNSSLP
jgi:hypothetical protein